MPKAIRWSGENDRYFGPFTYARERRYRPLAIVLGSGDNDDYPGCRLRLSAFGHTLIVALPAVVRPAREWVDTSHYHWSHGSGGYWDTHEREFGFSCAEGFLQVFRGRRTHDSTTDRTWGWFLPWKSWRHVRHSLYGLSGEHFATEPQSMKWDSPERVEWDAIEASCPARVFAFRDFDGEALTVITRIGEREWRLGEGRFKWLSLFRRPKVERSLDLRFSGETGKRKGSWKGGTLGHAITMLPGELHEAAFRRYCAENNMTFVGPALTVVQP